MQHWWLLFIHSCIGFAASVADSTESSLVKSAESRSELETFFYPPNRRDKTRGRDSYIPVLLKRNDKKIEARIPVIVGNRTDVLRDRKRKAGSGSSNSVPVVRGAAVPLRSDLQDLQAESIEGLHPPSQTAAESWVVSQQQAIQYSYPDSNGYYPTVGNGDGGYPSTSPRPRPTYGVPTQAPQTPHWACPSVPMPPWGQGETYPHTPSYPNPYPPTTNYPSGCQPPQNNYPSSCPPTNYPSGYPPSQGYPSGYPSSNNYPGTSSSGNYPQNSGSSSNGNYPQQSLSGQSSWHYSGRPWKQESKAGQWHPCRPFDLTNTDGRRSSSSGCPQNLRSANTVRFEHDATPVTKIDDKNNFGDLPKDVEMLKL